MKRKSRKALWLGGENSRESCSIEHPPNFYLGIKNPGVISFEILKKFLLDLREKFFQKAIP